MAERRMFAKTIIDSDAFLDMSLSTQALYFHLSMRADDEGFINNPKKIQRMIGASDDDVKMLIAKNFIIPFESGVVVIKHWKIHNYIRNDRLVSTKYQDEKLQLTVKDNGAYTQIEKSDDILEFEELDSQDKRKMAYKKSSLPYSFDYKMRRAFEGQVCPVCGRVMTSSIKTLLPTIQHNIPISKGGVHEIENISVICETCNTSIKDKPTDELNNEQVALIWDKIVTMEGNNTKWFWTPEILWQASDGQMTDNGQPNVSIGKDRIGEDRLGKDISIDIVEIVTYLNELCGTNYKSNGKKIRSLISARMNEGFTVEDFKTVIWKKSREWKDDPNMCQYLRPITLFGTKFESYLNQQTVMTKEEKRMNELQEWLNE